MDHYQVKLKDKKEIAINTMAFFFEKPPIFRFEAGQHLNCSLINPTVLDQKGTSRFFSIASSPREPHLMIATRLTGSAFKNNLSNLPLNSLVQIKGPLGNFTLSQNPNRPVVFITGGIGITPFRSMIMNQKELNFPYPIFLFYSNRRPEDAVFLKELMDIHHPNFTFVGTMTDMVNSRLDWSGETRSINVTFLTDYLHHLTNYSFYTAGPPSMVTAMYQLLQKAGVQNEKIRYEEFLGYQ